MRCRFCSTLIETEHAPREILAGHVASMRATLDQCVGSGAAPTSAAGGAAAARLQRAARILEKVEESSEPASRASLASAMADVGATVDGGSSALCTRCVGDVARALDAKLAAAREEKRVYMDYLEGLEAEATAAAGDGATEESDGGAEDELAALQAADWELGELRARAVAALARRRLLERDLKALVAMERRAWAVADAAVVEAEAVAGQLACVRSALQRSSARLAVLMRTNVHNDAFFVWHDGPIGTINRFRLGRLPSNADQHVEWHEINAAWGQAAMLLATAAQQMNFEFKTFRIVPFGSYAKLSKVRDERTIHSLYFNPAGWSPTKRFNRSMAAFMSCLKEVGDEVMLRDRSSRVPYPVEVATHKIGGASISFKSNGRDHILHWTRALKYVLTNLKWIVCAVAKAKQRL